MTRLNQKSMENIYCELQQQYLCTKLPLILLVNRCHFYGSGLNSKPQRSWFTGILWIGLETLPSYKWSVMQNTITQTGMNFWKSSSEVICTDTHNTATCMCFFCSNDEAKLCLAPVLGGKRNWIGQVLEASKVEEKHFLGTCRTIMRIYFGPE